jgi:hypothetical protein
MLAITENVEPHNGFGWHWRLRIEEIKDGIDGVGYSSFPGMAHKPVCISYLICSA